MGDQEIHLVSAIADNYAIGHEGDLPWKSIQKDFEHFQRYTKGHPVVMGRKTYESIPESFRPLPERENIVVTRRDLSYPEPTVHVVHSIEEALQLARQYTQPTIIGGGQSIYEATINQADVLMLTRITRTPDGKPFKPAYDARFPEINTNHWKLVHEEPHTPDEKNPYYFQFERWERT